MSAKVSARQGASPGDGSRRWIGPVAALLVFSVVAWLLHRELEQIRVHDIIEHLQAIAGETLLTGLLLTAGSYLALCLYDFVALRYLHKKVPLGRVVVASCVGGCLCPKPSPSTPMPSSSRWMRSRPPRSTSSFRDGFRPWS